MEHKFNEHLTIKITPAKLGNGFDYKTIDTRNGATVQEGYGSTEEDALKWATREAKTIWDRIKDLTFDDDDDYGLTNDMGMGIGSVEQNQRIYDTTQQPTTQFVVDDVNDSDSDIIKVEQLATKADIIEADEQVFKTSKWNPTSKNSVLFWQDVNGDISPYYRNHWYIAREDAYSSVNVRVGRTKAQVNEWVRKNLASRQ